MVPPEQFEIYLEKIYSPKNCKRYYSLEIQQGLFGPTLTRRWGRIGNRRYSEIVMMFDDDREAVEKGMKILQGKIKKGYEVISKN